jgi:hypothetical protein
VNHDELELVGKLRRLRALQRARERVKRSERELRGEPVGAEAPNDIPEFLRPRSVEAVAKQAHFKLDHAVPTSHRGGPLLFSRARR